MGFKKKTRFAHLDRCFARTAFVEALSGPISHLGLRASGDPLVIGLTAPGRREGVSTISLYLGRQIANTLDCRVLVVELNLSHPAVGKYCRIASDRCFERYVAGTSPSLREAAQEIPGTRLSVLPAGKDPRDLLEFVVSERFERFLEQAREEYHVILLDLPPVLKSASAVSALRLVDRRVIVVRANKATRGDVQSCTRRMRELGIAEHGAILNRWYSVI